ncbi:MAG: hypothetical protein IJT49_04745 [Clostridia bacterium]|nr:hypothetical protein [Clostridia bacterium]
MKKAIFAVVLAFTVLASACAAPAADTEKDTSTDAAETAAQTLAELITDAQTEKETEQDQTQTDRITETQAEEAKETVSTETETDIITEETETEQETEAQKENGVYLLYKNAAEKTNSLKNARQKALTKQDVTASFTDGGQIRSSSSVSSDIRFCFLGEDGFRCEGTESLTEESDGAEKTVEYEFFADKDAVYLKDRETGIFKKANDGDPGASSVKALVLKENLYISVMPESVFAGAVLTENEDGTKTVKASPSDKDASGALDGMKEKLESVFAAFGAQNVKYGVKDAKYVFTVSADGYIIRSEAEITVDIEMTVANTAVKASSVSSTACDLLDYEKPAEIEVPVIE